MAWSDRQLTEPEQDRRWVHLVVFIKTWNWLIYSSQYLGQFYYYLLVGAWGRADSVTIFRLGSVSYQNIRQKTCHYTALETLETQTRQLDKSLVGRILVPSGTTLYL